MNQSPEEWKREAHEARLYNPSDDDNRETNDPDSCEEDEHHECCGPNGTCFVANDS